MQIIDDTGFANTVPFSSLDIGDVAIIGGVEHFKVASEKVERISDFFQSDIAGTTQVKRRLAVLHLLLP